MATADMVTIAAIQVKMVAICPHCQLARDSILYRDVAYALHYFVEHYFRSHIDQTCSRCGEVFRIELGTIRKIAELNK